MPHIRFIILAMWFWSFLCLSFRSILSLCLPMEAVLIFFTSFSWFRNSDKWNHTPHIVHFLSLSVEVLRCTHAVCVSVVLLIKLYDTLMVGLSFIYLLVANLNCSMMSPLFFFWWCCRWIWASCVLSTPPPVSFTFLQMLFSWLKKFSSISALLNFKNWFILLNAWTRLTWS